MNKGNKNKKEMSACTKAALLTAAGALSGLCGYWFGRMMKRAEKNGGIDDIKESVKAVSVYAVPILYIALMLIFFAIAGARYIKASRAYKRIGKDDDEKLIELEHSLDLPVALMNIWSVLDLMFYAIMIEITEVGDVSGTLGRVLSAAATIILVGSYIMLIAVSRKCLMLIKKINPEKRGDLLDVNFYKKWEDSCDEAQKIIMYKAAYRAFKITNYSFMAAWVVCVISQLVFRTGVIPVICISAVWLIMVVVYDIESSRLEK